jgi:hypothetical protein
VAASTGGVNLFAVLNILGLAGLAQAQQQQQYKQCFHGVSRVDIARYPGESRILPFFPI